MSPVSATWSGAARTMSAAIASATAGAVHAVAVEPPVEHADRPLQGEVPARRARGQGPEMKVGEMGEAEHGQLADFWLT